MSIPERPPGTEGSALMDEVMLRRLRQRCAELNDENRRLTREVERLRRGRDETIFHGLEAA